MNGIGGQDAGQIAPVHNLRKAIAQRTHIVAKS